MNDEYKSNSRAEAANDGRFRTGLSVFIFAVFSVLALSAVFLIIAPSMHNTSAAKAGESVPAPFGLRWGMTCPEIIALGAENILGTPCRRVANLPEELDGFEVFLNFDDNGELIGLVSDNFFAKDRNPGISRHIAKTLRATLVKKYGKEKVSVDTPSEIWLEWDFEDGSQIILFCSFVAASTDPSSAVALVYLTKAHGETLGLWMDEIEAEVL